uniref:Uncharacterized protein n=1 Tax=Arundo donax TaxID=35708 RepID=A0A0A9HK81_ARUDO
MASSAVASPTRASPTDITAPSPASPPRRLPPSTRPRDHLRPPPTLGTSSPPPTPRARCSRVGVRSTGFCSGCRPTSEASLQGC